MQQMIMMQMMAQQQQPQQPQQPQQQQLDQLVADNRRLRHQSHTQVQQLAEKGMQLAGLRQQLAQQAQAQQPAASAVKNLIAQHAKQSSSVTRPLHTSAVEAGSPEYKSAD
jgi:hypothetical protein